MSMSMRRRPLWALALPAAIALSACGGGAGSGALAPVSSIVPAVRGHAHQAKLPSQLLFVPDMVGSVYIYALKNPNQRGPLGVISGLLGDQYQSTVDANGNFYIASQGVGLFPSTNEYNVAKIAPPYTGQPTFFSTTWQGVIFGADGLTVDRKGNVYVTACGSYCTHDPNLRGVLVYPPGAKSPKEFVPVTGFDTVGALTIDTKGNLYGLAWNVASTKADVFEIAAGTKTVKMLGLRGFRADGNSAGGIAVDTAGHIYVSNPVSLSSYVLEYHAGAHEPFRQIDLGSWLAPSIDPMYINIGPDGNLYVPVGCGAGKDGQCPQVYAFKPATTKPFEVIGSQSEGGSTMSVATFPNAMLQGAAR
jgi:hypothetical protein